MLSSGAASRGALPLVGFRSPPVRHEPGCSTIAVIARSALVANFHVIVAFGAHRGVGAGQEAVEFMSKRLLIQLALSLLFLVGGVVSYLAIVPVLTVNYTSLSRFVISDPKIAHITAKATYAQPTPILTSRVPILLTAYNISPGQTGAFTSQWFGLGSKGGNAGIFFELLPTKALATQAASQQVAASMSQTALTAVKYTYKSSFSIPGLPGSSAVYYLIPRQPVKNSAGVPIPQSPIAGYTAEIQIGRSASRIDLNGFAATKSGLIQIAQHQAAQMKAGTVGFKNMASHAYPLGSGALVAVATAFMIGLVYLIPFSRRRVELARLAREQARRRYQLQSRGAKIARRRGTARR